MSISTIPRFEVEQVREMVLRLYGLECSARELVSYSDQNFLLTLGDGHRLLFKVANQAESRDALDFQNRAMEHVAGKAPELGIQRVCSTLRGERIAEVESDESKYLVRLLTFLDGNPWPEHAPHSPEIGYHVGRFLGFVDHALEDFEHPAMFHEQTWEPRRFSSLAPLLDEIDDRSERRRIEKAFEGFARHVVPVGSALRRSVVHGDASDNNLLLDDSGQEMVGLIDFGDVMHTWTVFEVAVAMTYAMFDQSDPWQMGSRVLAGYHEVYPLEAMEIEVLGELIQARLATSLMFAARSHRLDPDNTYATSSRESARRLLEQFQARERGEISSTFEAACGETVSVAHGRSSKDILEARRRHLGGSLSISYGAHPLKIMRGAGPYLIDHRGRAYLDAINNVNHVGHNHPRVVAAAHEQMKVLNTNTRYLHDNLVEYAERLTATLPDPLSVCYFVNSGSEANDLALRMARVHTGHHDAVVVDAAYHGTTICAVEMSSYKFDGPGGAGQAPYVHMVPTPDVYRGPHKAEDPEAGAKYAEDVRRAIDEAHADGRRIAAYFCESMLSCGGQVILPPGYLREVFRHVRAAGGVCVNDEVQVGFGRPGSHFWAFETQDVVPDIVTLGKPIGNGHPMSAVVTTPEIAASFDNGMEYFNTFGGNPVSCAVGLAVLDIVQEDGLQDQARVVGEHLLVGLRELTSRHEIIGDVRGHGMFLGIELVHDRQTLEPATEEATAVINASKERGVLLSTEGPLHNIIKIKPPLVWTTAHADILVEVLDSVMAEGL